MPSSYDIVAYPGYPFAQSHPDRMAAIGTLLGLRPPPTRRCRVLELACGDGGNLIPMAVGMPKGRFVGIDLAAEPIARGKRTIAALGLKNITLRECDVLKVDRSWGEFDYIITHGLYSWSPPVVRNAILRISSENLAPRGIAYISYNALPGGRIRQMLREMMLFHTADFEDPLDRTRQARELLSLVARGRLRNDSFNTLVQEEAGRITDNDLWFLFHDELAAVYEPVYLHELVEHAGRQGLQYLADANLYNLRPGSVTEEAREVVEQVTDDRVTREQYFDFIECRRFRHSLLCHQGEVVSYPPEAERIAELFLSSPATAASEHPDLSEGVEEEFRGPLNSAMKTAHPVAKALLAKLIEAAPQALSFDRLVAQIGGNKRRAEAISILLATSLAGLTDVHTTALPLTNRISRHPVASPLARYQISQGLPLTTLNHATAEAVGGLEARLLPLLDGKRDQAALQRKLRVKKDDLQASLQKLARLAFLQR